MSVLHPVACAFAVALFAASSVAAADGLVSTPLATHSGPHSGTLFTPLAPEQTGIVTENKYDDPRMWNELFHEFEVGAIGTGVAIADYDNDGRPDLFVVSKTESCRLFRNLGDWKFEDVTARAGVGDAGESARIWKQGASFADINNDGHLDLYVCRFRAPNLLYLNQGDGTFREEAASRGLALADASGMAAFCDYDRDGWLDVHIQTNLLDAVAQPDGQQDRLYRNNRDGTFTDVTPFAGLAGVSQGHSATWWDFNEDGWPDLYVANDFAVPDHLYRNNRDGTFTDIAASVLPHTPYSAMGADLGDLDGDGRLDLLVADMAATTHEKDHRGMAASRARTTAEPANDPAAGAPQYLRNALYLNAGPGIPLQEAAFLAGLAATDWTWAVRLEDFDNDGRLDAFFTTGMVRELHNSDLLIRMMTSENARERVRVMERSPLLAEPNLAFKNIGDLRFENAGAAWGLDHNGVSFGAATGDLDGDGDLDLIYSNYRQGVTVLRNDSATGHRAIITLRGTVSNHFGVGATVTLETASGLQVRQLVLARGYLSTSEPVLHFGLGADTTIDRLTIRWPSGHEQILTGLSADHRHLITEPANATPARAPLPGPETIFAEASAATGFNLVAREEYVDETALQPLLSLRLDRRGPSLAMGDVNSDGHIDALLGGTARDPRRLLPGTAGGFANPVNLGRAGSPVSDGPVLFFDVDADGDLDLLVTKGGAALPAGAPNYRPDLLLGDGRGGFQPAPAGSFPEWRSSVGAAAAADWDRDGHVDLFIGGRVQPGDYPMPPRSALLSNRGGRFTDATPALAPALRDIGMVTAALWSDVDADGWPDLLLALDWGHVRYFHNEQDRGFADRTTEAGFAAAGTGWWSSLASADFNEDGRPDFAAGNLGLNTEYHATADAPAYLYYGDFKGDGSYQLVEAHHEAGQLYPRRTRKELGAAIPALLKKYPRHDTFARATLDEIFGANVLAAAQCLTATEFRSGLFLSQPDGTYRFTALPRRAQIAPIHGLAAEDFDGDGHADLYAVQNSHAPVPSIGRFHGGLSQLLKGDGRGSLTIIPPAESGLIVSGDARNVAAVDLNRDGWADLLVTRNDASSLAFLNRGVPGRRPPGVRSAGTSAQP